MTVTLTGQLTCRSPSEAETVRRHLPAHIAATRAEPGCLSFEVTPTNDPLVWDVRERFTDSAALDAHRSRAATTDWARATVGISRRYQIREP